MLSLPVNWFLTLLLGLVYTHNYKTIQVTADGRVVLQHLETLLHQDD